MSASCSKCGTSVHECGGWLERVNPKGEDPIWECRPACGARLTDEEALLGAVAGHVATVRSFKPLDRVIYVPMHAHGDRGHPDCERGCVSSVNAHGTVFVKFNAQVARLGWDGTTAQGCDADDLLLE